MSWAGGENLWKRSESGSELRVGPESKPGDAVPATSVGPAMFVGSAPPVEPVEQAEAALLVGPAALARLAEALGKEPAVPESAAPASGPAIVPPTLALAALASAPATPASAPQENADSDRCVHCGLGTPLPGERFCCAACALVYEAITGAGLEAYYKRRDQPALGPAALPEVAWAAAFNLPAVQQRYVRLHEGLLEASFVLEGLHCAACCWLVEHAVRELGAVREAWVNFATARLRVRWVPDQGVGLGDLVARVARFGYRAVPYDPTRQELPRLQASRQLLLRTAVAGLCAGNIMLLAAALYAGYFSGIEDAYRTFFHQVCLVLALPVVGYAAVPFYQGAARAWAPLPRAGTGSSGPPRMTMDLPITTGLLVTFFYSVWATYTHRAEVYFDTVANFTFVLLVGRWLETSARSRAAATVESLLARGARTAWVERDGQRQEVPIEEVCSGDTVVVLPGGTIPTDGVITQGSCYVDESMLTGEAVPVGRGVGDGVQGGTLCIDGLLRMRATTTGSQGALARIARLVEEAGARQPALQRLADRAAARFVLVTLGLAALTVVLWWPYGSARALMTAVSVLIITCPCALGLATPLAVAAASARAARAGVLVRGGDVLEALATVDEVWLDKTGTLTEGRFELQIVLTAPGIQGEEVLRLAAALERNSTHPLARALVMASLSMEGPSLEVDEFTVQPGRGLRARLAGQEILLGNRAYLDLEACAAEKSLVEAALSWEARGSTLVWMARNREVVACFALVDRVRPEAAEVVAQLRAQGLEIGLLSGDRPAVVEAVARQVGIGHWHAALLPADKLALLQERQNQGHRVAMVGDGINDAPALSAAHVGLAMACGTDISTQAAGVVLLRPGLLPLLSARSLAQSMVATIRDNMTLSVLYNLMAIPAAMAGWVAPVVAAVAMPLSSLFVVFNSLRTPHPATQGEVAPWK